MASVDLTNDERSILQTLDTVGGYLTGDVAKKVPPITGINRRQHSAKIRSILIGLELKGLVRRLDAEKPVCWVKVST